MIDTSGHLLNIIEKSTSMRVVRMVHGFNVYFGLGFYSDDKLIDRFVLSGRQVLDMNLKEILKLFPSTSEGDDISVFDLRQQPVDKKETP